MSTHFPPSRPHVPRRSLRGLARDARGGVSVEYLVVTALGVFVALALGALGLTMVRAFGTSLQFLYSGSP